VLALPPRIIPMLTPLCFAFMLSASALPDNAPTQPSADDVGRAIREAERHGTYVVDPLDGQRKAHLVNREQNIRSYVQEDGTWIIAQRGETGARVGLRLVGAARGATRVGDDSVFLDDTLVHQTWLNTDRGIEHTILLDAPPSGGDTHHVRLPFAVEGAVTILRTADHVDFEQDANVTFSYKGLLAFDGNGLQQTAWFEINDAGNLVIAVDLDDGAPWPVLIDPIVTTPYRSINYQSSAANNRFGEAMAVGDFNHDGVADLAVGGGYATPIYTTEGVVKVYAGGGASPLGTEILSYRGGAAGDRCGTQVATGDFNGANGDDLVVACPGSSTSLRYFLNTGTGLPSTPTFTVNTACVVNSMVAAKLTNPNKPDVAVTCDDGSMRVYRVAAGNSTATQVWSTPGLAGYAIHLIKLHLNVDQYDDLAAEQGGLISFYRADQVSILVPDATRPALDYRAYFNTTNSPITLAAANFDGDGLDDLLVGNPAYSSDAGRVFVLDNNGITFTPNTYYPVAYGAPSERLGSAVFGADLNHDLYGDLVLCGTGLPFAAGRCHVFPGAPKSLFPAGFDVVDQGPIVPYAGTVGLGDAPLVAGDFTNDGALDVVVPDVAQDKVTVWNAGIANLDGVPRAPLLAGAHNASQVFGQVIVMADVNGDGRADLLVGAPGYDAGLSGAAADGAVFGFAGGNVISSTPTWTQVALGVGDGQFGSSIAVGRFFSDTGPVVVAVGAPGESPPGSPVQCGRVRLFPAAAHGFPPDNGKEVQALDGSYSGDAFGTALANAGQLVATANKGDSLAVGAPQPTKTPPSIKGGYVSVFYPSGTAVALNSAFFGNAAAVGCKTTFGASVSNVGNVDGRNSHDLVVGAPGCHVPDDGGQAFLLTSSAGSYVAPVVSTWKFGVPGAQAGAQLGTVVAGLGDTSGDRSPDFAISAPKMDGGFGRIFVFHGASSALPSTNPSVVITSTSASWTGASIAPAEVRNGILIGHDINRDGIMDLLEGEPQYTGLYAAEGRARAFLGKSGGLNTSPSVTLLGTCTSCKFGTAVALGDMGCSPTGPCGASPDGFADGAIGQPGLANGTMTKAGQVQLFQGKW
jgi:hypothetical protein